MKRAFSLILFLAFAGNLRSQEGSKSNSLFFELGGLTGSYSVNFQKKINFNEHFGLNAGIGFSPQLGNAIFYTPEYIPAVPIRLSFFYSFNKNHLLDAGVAITPFYDNFWVNFGYRYLFQGLIGYRYTFPKNRYFLEFNFCPTYEYYSENDIYFNYLAGVKFGYNFGKIESKNVVQDTSCESALSFMVSPLNLNTRVQYERGCKTNSSFGFQLIGYHNVLNFPGVLIEGFYRQYCKKHGNSEGFFVQEKLGLGYFRSALFAPPYTIQKSLWGYTTGGGIAAGNKMMLGNYLFIETILGLQFYVPPIVFQSVLPGYKEQRDKHWYSTTGLPVDFQVKVGWRY